MTRRRLAGAFLSLPACLAPSRGEARAQRGMTVEDLLSIENLGAISLSPDGEWAALEIQRSRREAGHYPRTRLGGDDRADVWVVSTSTGERRRITDGASDGSGWWAPAWSPDGERLAMLSSRGNDRARLFVWSRRGGTLEPLSEEGVHVGAPVAAAGAKGNGFVWVDAATLLAVLLPPDFRPFDFVGDHETLAAAPRAWERMRRGLEPSVSVLVSGEGAPPRAGVATVALLDVAGRSTPLAEVGAALFGPPQASLAPDGKHLALFETSPSPPPSPGMPMTFEGRGLTRLGIVRVGTAPDPPRWLEGIARPSLASVAWSPDGRTLAALAPREGEAGEALHLVEVATGVRRRASPPDWNVRRFLWLDSRRLAVQASAGAATREDGWILGPDGATRNLTATLSEAPASMERGPEGTILAISSGDLWRIDPAEGPRNLTASLSPAVRSFVPRQGLPSDGESRDVLFEAGEERETSPYRILLDGDRVEEVSLPSPRAKLDAHWASKGVVRASEEGGEFAWVQDLSTGRTTRLAAINEHLADIAPARRLLIEYRGADGEPLKGLVLLPHDYQEGKRYPVLTWVYAGDVFRDVRQRRSLADKYNSDSLNPLPLLARGYVVLLPSIPLGPDGSPGDPMIDLPKGVIAAVDRVIELGIADPDRLAVGGHSYGGYSVFAMVAWTSRFKAAIAAAGASNLVSLYGALDPRFRYGDTATEGVSQIRWMEGGQGRMGGPPHEDLWRYLRNSPIHFVDRVRTPVLIIQGDMDFVPLAQGEEFFLGLWRQGKAARFVRYFGESHTVESAANVRHMWREIFDWLDTRLGSADSSRSPR